MKVSLVTGSLSRFGGGVAVAVQALSRSLLAAEAEVSVVGLRDESWETDAAQWEGIPTSPLRVLGPAAIGYARESLDHLRASGADIVHSHGIWKHPSRAVLQWAIGARRPYVVSPHGMLDAWALRRSVWKKRIVSRLYEDAHLRRAGCLHALCEAEAQAIRDLGFDNPICVIPNGISLPPIDDSRTALWQKFVPEDHRVMLFLGRLHPKKNLPALIEAWPLDSADAKWHLVVAGWDQCGHEDILRTLVKRRSLQRNVHFLGPLFGREKDAALRRADAFVLPSLSEGLPISTLEAWSYGLPVLQTEACNLPEGFREAAAFRLSPGPDAMARDLRAFMRIEPEKLGEMGRNGRNLVARNFCWNGIARQWLEVYAWLLEGGAQPASVRISGQEPRFAA
jgi:glycosyltransferase involved in cell wall biosynthesis